MKIIIFLFLIASAHAKTPMYYSGQSHSKDLLSKSDQTYDIYLIEKPLDKGLSFGIYRCQKNDCIYYLMKLFQENSAWKLSSTAYQKGSPVVNPAEVSLGTGNQIVSISSKGMTSPEVTYTMSVSRKNNSSEWTTTFFNKKGETINVINTKLLLTDKAKLANALKGKKITKF